jgi:hypothetical protein
MTGSTKDRIAGILAFIAGLCWFAWAVINISGDHVLERAAVGSLAATTNSLLTAGWNLLLIPSALRLHSHLRNSHPKMLFAATIAGILSLTLWAIGGFTRISHNLETVYLALGAVWLLNLGLSAVQNSRAFGYFTLLVGAITLVDAVFNLFEPMPFAVYLLAAPKLPLSALWSLVVGVFLIRKTVDRTN